MSVTTRCAWCMYDRALTGSQLFGKACPPQTSGQATICALHHVCLSAAGTWLTVMVRGPEVEKFNAFARPARAVTAIVRVE